ncbi:DGAT1/2-independent enzyme synthesizing storage lipids-like isoform X2 [Pelodiscus sinensis]|uniref:DGAT1/2-independent enzyme synthesizing storage lipids-like isoform X2 n=1 Tax=Pelodiscus sinensis TaxID=13735 RepID=UPI000D72004E|nr:transmembrane protein 68-like isoform X2 [Pelodiscus sinensis]|eukprot:XP_025042046.1 transmembrane protein 68-like isoform X2 [Pelodiscus sinensis]
MTNKSEFYTSGWESVTNSTWLIYILKDWIGQDYHYPDYMGTFLGVTVTILFSPLLPWFIVCLFCNLCLHIYKRMNGLEDDFSSKLWDNGKLMMSHIIHMYGKLWHGIQMFLKLLPAVYGGREECVEILKKGNLLGVAPGGAQESFFSSESYNLLWGNRKGFAQVAIDAKVPIIPLFTQNIREGYRTLGNMWFIKWLNKRFQLSFVPGYGGFPVKLRTYIGDPIPYDPNIAATELVEKTKIAIERLRDTHQKLPGNILRALLERFDKHQKAA